MTRASLSSSGSTGLFPVHQIFQLRALAREQKLCHGTVETGTGELANRGAQFAQFAAQPQDFQFIGHVFRAASGGA